MPKRGVWISQEELRNLWKVIEGSFVPSPSAAETATPRTFLQPASVKVPKKAVKHEPLISIEVLNDEAKPKMMVMA